MAINMSQTRVMDSSKRLKRLLQDMGIERTGAECLELSARLLGFKSWDSYWHQRDLPLSPLDQDLTDEEFLARDALQMKVLEAEGFGDCYSTDATPPAPGAATRLRKNGTMGFTCFGATNDMLSSIFFKISSRIVGSLSRR